MISLGGLRGEEGSHRCGMCRAHPSSKLLWMISFSSLPLVASSPEYQAVLLLLVTLTSIVGGVGLRPLSAIRHLAVPIGIIVALNFAFTRDLRFSVGMGLRMSSMAAAAFLFFAVTDPMEVADLLTMMGAPPPVALAGMVAIRFIPVMVEDLRGSAAAQRSRGYRSDVGGPVERIRRLAPILIPALVLVVKRSQAVAESVESRGFGRGRRSLYPDYRFRGVDLLLVSWALIPWLAILIL